MVWIPTVIAPLYHCHSSSIVDGGRYVRLEIICTIRPHYEDYGRKTNVNYVWYSGCLCHNGTHLCVFSFYCVHFLLIINSMYY